MITTFSHIGLAVKNLDEVLHIWTDVLGLKEVGGSMAKDYPEFGFRNRFVRISDDVFIELMESTNPDNEIGRWLEKRGEGMYHLCLAVDDLDAEIESLKAQGADVIEIPASPDVPGKRAFLRRRYMHGVLIELVQQSDLDRWDARKGGGGKIKSGK